MIGFIFIGMTIICAISLSACGKVDEIPHVHGTEDIVSKEWQPDDSILQEPRTYASVEEEVPSRQEPEEAGSEHIQWHVYIQPDMPEPYIEIFEQYEDFINAGEEDIIYPFDIDGEWRYLYDIYCMRLKWRVEHNEAVDHFRYSLKDLTGDGFPELIMGYHSDFSDETSPDVVYYYCETGGIKMECLSDYYDMVLYEGGVIEYISGGVTYTETYLQFQEETDSFERAVRVVVDWDFETDSVKGYYWGENTGDLLDNEPMSEKEYQEIVERYAAEPVKLEWTPIIFNVE